MLLWPIASVSSDRMPLSRGTMSCILAAEAAGRHFAGEQEDLHHGAAAEDLDECARGRLHFRSGFAHRHSGDPLNFLPERIGSVSKQPPMISNVPTNVAVASGNGNPSFVKRPTP